MFLFRKDFCLQKTIQYLLPNHFSFQRRTNSTIVHFGICTPSSCSSNDIILFLSHITGGLNQIKITPNKCHTNEITTYTSVDIVYG